MGVLRVAFAWAARPLVIAAGAVTLVAACSSSEPAPSEADLEEREPDRVPDPLPRYKRVDTDAGITVPDANEPTLHIKCGGYRPYVCPLDDGTFQCSDHPCVPDCDRVGCLGGETCLACDGGFRCVASGNGC